MAQTLSYAGMSAGVIVIWILLTTVAGLIARQIVQGKPLMGLWGDMAFGLLGVFILGTILRRAGVDLSQAMLRAVPDATSSLAIWLDVLIVGVAGALVLRFALKLVGR